MDFIYDIMLNFQNLYYEFYEWRKDDNIINVKKIPIYRITPRDYLNIKYHSVVIERKALPKSNKMFLLATNDEIMGVLIDETGEVIKRSSLLIDEADEIRADIDTIKIIPLKYMIKKTNLIPRLNRYRLEKQIYLNSFFNKLNINRDAYVLKYLYYEIYHIDEPNIDIVLKKLKSLIKKDLDSLYINTKQVLNELKKTI